MSHPDQPTDQPKKTDASRPEPAVVDPSPSQPVRSATTRAPARPRGGGSLALALLLSLVALAAAGYVGWQQWQQQRGSAADSQSRANLQQRVDTLQTRLGGFSDQRASFDQRLDDAASVNRSLREELLGQGERIRNLEDALAKLAEKSLSGHDTMLLDETDSLLRMGAERYTLFHDAQAAAAAYGLADQTLAAVNDGAFSGVRQSIQAEREALLKSQPASQAGALQQLQRLRGAMAGLPLKPLDVPTAGQATDAWSRLRRALASVVSVHRDNGAPLSVADARFARELAALDLAQAQAALLAHDGDGYAAALHRVETSLASQFDDSAAAVQQARATLQQLQGQLPAKAPVELGAALTELRNLRAVHALAPAGAAPAPAASTAPHRGGARP
ncbi:MAG TPA: uroporphyrinogen-III C-methyltransferase [Rhodanobacter sp.]|nr:uroporphyrinogen-III C-methyltransferase [Rhodanobacter sp.]